MTTIQNASEEELQQIRELLEAVVEERQGFENQVHKTLNEYNTYNRVLDGIRDNNLEAVLRTVNWDTLESIRGLIYFKDFHIYNLLWKKPPTKSSLKRAIDLMYS